MLVENRRVVRRIKLKAGELAENHRPPAGHKRRVNIGVHAGQHAGHFVPQLPVARQDICVNERAVVKQVPMHPVGKAHAELRAVDQRLEHPGDLRRARQLAGEVVDVDVPTGVAEGPLRIPDDELILPAGHALPGRAPVVVRPVAGAGVNVHDQVVDEVVDIDHRAGGGVGVRGGHVLPGDVAQHFVPLGAVALAHFAELRHQIPIIGAAVPGTQEVGVDAFGGIVETFVLTVEE